jgi:hypothetical protein
MKEQDDGTWQLCRSGECSEPVNPKRWALGYQTCLAHPEPRKEFPTAVPYNKGGYQLITRFDLSSLGRKDDANA